MFGIFFYFSSYFKMEAPKLNNDEWKLYSELFASCDTDGTGRLRVTRVTSLLQTADLSSETLSRVRILYL